MHMRQTVTAVVTGKPINIGGSRSRRGATGRGIMIVCDQAGKKLGLTPESTRVLEQGFDNVCVIRDILCNAGGVTTSYFEWVQDRQGYFWKESVVNEQLEDIMVNAFDDVVRYSETHNVNNRIAAYMLAIDRVAYTIKQRGIYA